ncbi:hypothetical protein, variant [Aphanomyces invadans]|uniref:WW domain-containing protein n=1 Tax=Aphanomyces invadans TaxID=157072 RepID=A0A024UQN2_9STRA|nr:hypothetical protein, variant [Aphanomyces invadans]ETW08614.1 hypothetical protein, variant [Aphanomyces invadans]|eukprot:XP_008862419.1 hypothetical protein, variant [Aphanomyces invadans]
MGGLEQKEALVAHGREVLQKFRGKERIPFAESNLQALSSSSTTGDSTPKSNSTQRPRQDKLWNSIMNSHVENGQLSESIERNALKLVDYILANDKTPHSNLAQLAAPIASALRQLCHRKQQLEATILRDLQVLGPPLVVDSTTSTEWITSPDVQTLVNNHTTALKDELHAAQTVNKSLEIKLNAYKTQLQQLTGISSSVDSTTAPNTSKIANTANLATLTRQVVEKDELIAALKATLDDVARETTQMEKLIVVQMDTIAELKHTSPAGPVPVPLPDGDNESKSTHPDSQQSEGESIPADDGQLHKIDDFDTPLPPGWEMRVTNSGNVYFVHTKSKVTTWVDPRTHPIQVQTTAPGDPTPFPTPTTHYSIEFHEKRHIGIMFQPNFPVDQGAVVHRVLPDTPAALAKQVQPGHQLVAVNGHPIQDAVFKHVMLLLKGGYRPLILTFDRGMWAVNSTSNT